MKWYNQKAYKQHIKDLKYLDLDDKRKKLCFEFVNSVANSFPREYNRIGILDVNDLIQYGYCGLLESWDKLNWDRVFELNPSDQQAMIWKFIKNGIKYKILHGIARDRDTIRIPQAYYIDWHKKNTDYTYDMDIFLTQTFSSFFNNEYLDVVDDSGNYIADQLNSYLNDVMETFLAPLEKLVIKMFYGFDEPYDRPVAQARIAKEFNKSTDNIKKIKQRGMDKLKQNTVKELIEKFIYNEVTY